MFQHSVENNRNEIVENNRNETNNIAEFSSIHSRGGLFPQLHFNNYTII